MKKPFLLFTVLFSVLFSSAQWNPVTTGYNYYYFASDCIAQDTLMVAGYDNSTNAGKLIASYSGGLSWTEVTLPNLTPQLYAMDFPESGTGYLAGQSGTILKSTDHGSNWNNLSSGTTQQLSALWFIDKDTGYVAGSGGLLMKTLNGGGTWNTLNSGTTMIIHSVCFPTAKIGYAVAYGNPLASGIILKSSDYGVTWTQQSSPFFGSLNIRGQKVLFANSDTGLIAGLGGAVLYTFDGGQNWQKTGVGVTTDNLNYIAHAGNGTFWLCGGTGAILKTNDYGATVVDGGSLNTSIDYYTISICQDSTGFMFGTNGGALKTNNVLPGIKTVMNEFSFSVFPNPANEFVNIRSQEHIEHLAIYTMQGLSVAELNPHTKSKEIELSTKNLETGIYLIRCESANGSSVKRIVINR